MNRQRGFTIYLLMAALAAASILGVLLWQQIAINGEQKVKLDMQAMTIEQMQKDKAAAEAAVARRDSEIKARAAEVATLRTKLRALERENELVRAWRDIPLPQPVVDFLCEFTRSDSQDCVPPANPPARPPVGKVEGANDWRFAGLGRGHG